VSGTTVTKYYYAGSQRIAISVNGSVYYLLSDQLGSTTVTTDEQGALFSELRYDAWGEVRYPLDGHNPGPSDYTYTGQYSNVDDFGLLYYNARWYDPTIARFVQADSIVPDPDNSQSFDRFAYGLNNPSRYTDPTGHWVLESNKPEDEVRCKAFYHAYERVNGKESPLAAHKKEYYLTAAAYYWARMEENEIDIQIGADLLQSRADAVRINGWNSPEDAQSTAGDVAMGMAPDLIGPATIGIAGLFPANRSILKHIFREAPGHLAEDTAANRALLADIVQSENLVEIDINGNQIYAKQLSDGTEVWVEVRDGMIRNGGLNETPSHTR
jgi:RHS repeat-associated protein